MAQSGVTMTKDNDGVTAIATVPPDFVQVWEAAGWKVKKK